MPLRFQRPVPCLPVSSWGNTLLRAADVRIAKAVGFMCVVSLQQPQPQWDIRPSGADRENYYWRLCLHKEYVYGALVSGVFLPLGDP
jgi:hypothetical protein